jgi:ankyrin repeat protein
MFSLLQRFIGGRTQSEIDSLVSSKTGGCTPLLIACRNGHYDVVQYLLKRCHADVEQCGSVIFDGETIENGELGKMLGWVGNKLEGFEPVGKLFKNDF